MRPIAWSVSIALVAGLLLMPGPLVHAGKAGEVRVLAYKLLNQGVAAYKRGDYPEAIEHLERSSSMALNSFRAYYYLGLSLIGDRRYNTAIEALDIALDLDPDHLMSHVAMGDARLKLGDLSEAQASFFLALKFRPEFAPALDGLARIYESRADYAEAIEHYQRAIDQDAGYAPAYMHLGDLYLREEQFEEAVELLEEAVDVRPDFAAGLNRLALAYGKLGLHNSAVATINKAMELEPNEASHPATLGRIQIGQGFVSLGERWFVHALQLDPSEPVARAGLGEVARRRGEYELALGQIDQSLSDTRLDAPTRKQLEEYRQKVEDEFKKVTELQLTIDSGEAQTGDYAAMAAILAGRGEWTEAIELQKQAEPDLTGRERLAYMLFRADRFRMAHELYAALAEEAESPRLRLNDGVCVAQLGDDEAAVVAYRRVLEMEPDHLFARIYLANSLLRLGRETEAATVYRGLLDQHDRGEAAERVRRVLAQIAPEMLPEKPAPFQPDAEPPVAEDGSQGEDS